MKIDLTYDYILFSYLILYLLFIWWKYLDGTVVKNPLAHAGDVRAAGLIPVLERFCGIGNGNPFQYSCPENCLDRQPWWAIVHGVARTWTGLNNWAQTHTHTHRRRNWVNGSRIHSLCSFHVQSNSSYSRGIRIWSCLGSWCLDNSWRHYQLNNVSDLRDKVKYLKMIIDFKTWIWKLVVCILLLF